MSKLMTAQAYFQKYPEQDPDYLANKKRDAKRNLRDVLDQFRISMAQGSLEVVLDARIWLSTMGNFPEEVGYNTSVLDEMLADVGWRVSVDVGAFKLTLVKR